MNRLALAVLAGAFAVSVGPAQTVAVNTTLTGFVPLSGTPWVADITGFTDPTGDYVLAALGDDGLAVIDVTFPATAAVIQTIPATGCDLKDIRVYQGHAYCVQQQGDVLIVDVSTPASAAVVGTIPSTGGHNAYIDETTGRLYFSRSGASPHAMDIYDLSATPAAPTLLASYDPPGHNSHDAYAIGDRAYSFDIQSDVAHIVDVSVPTSPQMLATLPFGNHSGWAYEVPGGHSRVLVTCDERPNGFVHTFDVTDDAGGPPIGEYVTDPAISVHNAFVLGRYAYVSYYLDGLRIIDLGNPAAPAEVGVYDPTPVNSGPIFAGAWGVHPFSETKVVITEMFGAQGIYIVEFTPPPRVDLDVVTTGVGDVALTISNLDPSAASFLAVSLDVSQPIGTGPFLGIGSDGLLSVQAASPPFQASANAAGVYSLSLPAGIPVGFAVDMVAVSFKAAAGTFVASNLARIEF